MNTQPTTSSSTLHFGTVPEQVGTLSDNVDGFSEDLKALHDAIAENDVPRVAALLAPMSQDDLVELLTTPDSEGRTPLLRTVGSEKGPELATALLSTVQDEGNRVAIITQPNPYSYTTLMMAIENFLEGGGEKLAIAVLMTVPKARREEILRQPNNNKDSVLLQTIDFSFERETYLEALLSTLLED